MAFTVLGPGLRDEVLLDNLIPNDDIPKTSKIPRTHDRDPRRDENNDQRQPEVSPLGKQANKAYSNTREIIKEREPAIRARQIMTSPVVSLHENTSIVEAWQLFRNQRFRHVPVLSAKGDLIGLLSDRALLRYAAVTGNIPPYDLNSPQARISIKDICSDNVLTATPDVEIREIARLLIELHMGAMPIVDKYDNLVGIITRADILRIVVTQAPLELWI